METFDLYFAAVASIRFHPANVQGRMTDDEIRRELELAFRITELMLEVRRCRSLQQ